VNLLTLAGSPVRGTVQLDKETAPAMGDDKRREKPEPHSPADPLLPPRKGEEGGPDAGGAVPVRR
jgi:hypothetical protein